MRTGNIRPYRTQKKQTGFCAANLSGRSGYYKNVEKVTVPELERVTKLQRGAIFYHFKNKEAIFKEVIEIYFFSPINIFYPVNSDNVHSLKEYWAKKNSHLDEIHNWFYREGIPINPYSAFFHLVEQADLYLPTFKQDMYNLLEADRKCWIQVSSKDSKLSYGNMNVSLMADVLESIFLANYFKFCYNINTNISDYKITYIEDIEQLFK